MNPLNLKQKLKLPEKYQDNWKLGQALWVMGNTCTCIVGGVYWAALELRASHKPWEPPWSARKKSWRSPRTGGHHSLTWLHMSWQQCLGHIGHNSWLSWRLFNAVSMNTIKNSIQNGDFPGGPVVNTSPFNEGVWIGSLVRDLRSHMPHSEKPKT